MMSDSLDTAPLPLMSEFRERAKGVNVREHVEEGNKETNNSNESKEDYEEYLNDLEDVVGVYEDDELELEAVLKIQCAFRTRQARRQMASRRAEIEAIEMGKALEEAFAELEKAENEEEDETEEDEEEDEEEEDEEAFEMGQQEQFMEDKPTLLEIQMEKEETEKTEQFMESVEEWVEELEKQQGKRKRTAEEEEEEEYQEAKRLREFMFPETKENTYLTNFKFTECF